MATSPAEPWYHECEFLDLFRADRAPQTAQRERHERVQITAILPRQQAGPEFDRIGIGFRFSGHGQGL